MDDLTIRLIGLAGAFIAGWNFRKLLYLIQGK